MSELEKNTIENLIGKTNKQSGFITPDAYFDDLKKSILSKVEVDNLSIHKPKTGFFVPEDFFEIQKLQMLSKIAKPKAKRISLTYNQIAMRVASIAALFTVVGFLFLHNNSSKPINPSTSISSEEIVSHLEKNDVSEDLICELLDQTKPTKTENEIEKYLNEHADEELLMNDL